MSPKPGNSTSGGHHGSRSHAKELLYFLIFLLMLMLVIVIYICDIPRSPYCIPKRIRNSIPSHGDCDHSTIGIINHSLIAGKWYVWVDIKPLLYIITMAVSPSYNIFFIYIHYFTYIYMYILLYIYIIKYIYIYIFVFNNIYIYIYIYCVYI
jgi:hypothetical protein